MSGDTRGVRGPMREVKTQALVIRRTNYGEADRILTLVTPVGKYAVMARGVRRAKSKLASAVEMFVLSDVVLHVGRGELATLTHAKMLKFYGGILKDYEKLIVATTMLELANKKVEGGGEVFDILRQALDALDTGKNTAVVEAWFLLNLMRVSGEQVNLYRDTAGVPLAETERYEWSMAEEALVPRSQGAIDGDTIKIMRLMLMGALELALRVKNVENYVDEILKIARAVSKQ